MYTNLISFNIQKFICKSLCLQSKHIKLTFAVNFQHINNNFYFIFGQSFGKFYFYDY